mmetsp:Transcript_131605/g.232585  ORF Transcript_131605/g.232585 Transcript_131605/m.232585 type:complete len:151 (-) Transcript_131605:23-475(-)
MRWACSIYLPAPSSLRLVAFLILFARAQRPDKPSSGGAQTTRGIAVAVDGSLLSQTKDGAFEQMGASWPQSAPQNDDWVVTIRPEPAPQVPTAERSGRFELLAVQVIGLGTLIGVGKFWARYRAGSDDANLPSEADSPSSNPNEAESTSN